jgi:hypothetical protein
MRVDLSAVIVALEETNEGARPVVLTPRGPTGPDLPTVAFDPDNHRTLELALRDWVREATGLRLGHVEQLYTFGDSARRSAHAPDSPHVVSTGYLALSRIEEGTQELDWTPWTLFFPWEDRRHGAHPMIEQAIRPRLLDWAHEARGAEVAARSERIAICFGSEEAPWREEMTLERYELLYSARLMPEKWRDQGYATPGDLPRFGEPAPLDHRRILATGIGRLRAKLKYRPVLFELMPEMFTLYELQRASEALSGVPLHKQNFRRMVEKSGLIEPTGAVSREGGGRPAQVYRFLRERAWERRAEGVRFGGARRGG